MTTLQAVIFDYGGVMRGDDRTAFDRVDSDVGIPRGTLWAAFHDIPEYKLSRRGEIDRDTFRAAIRRFLVPATRGEARAVDALVRLDRYLADLPAVDPEMRALVGRLRRAGRVKLGLLSNADRGYTERFRERGITGLFDDSVISGDVGVAKPDPAVFLLAARRLGVEPTACLMIDDQPQHLESARGVGLRTHLFERARFGELVRDLEAEGVLD
jgi:HAD superfamily hydrolase (TIGR01509 family)